MNSGDTRITPGTGDAGKIHPIGFHGYAAQFAKYGRESQAAQQGQFSPVPYYLYCHSLELVLKAFLLAKGVRMATLRKKFGHDLSKILRKAKMLGVEQTVLLAAHWEREVRKANAYYAGKGFEYFYIKPAVKRYPDLPALDVLNEMVTALLSGLERVCLEA